MAWRATEPRVASVAGALLLAASSGAHEAVVQEPDVPRRPETSSFHFASTFQGEDALRTGEWVLSEHEKYEDQSSSVRVAPCSLEGGKFATDYGLLLDNPHKHYAVGATLPKPFDNTGKDLVMQYEVQVRNGPQCGGAYVKMLRGPAGQDMKTLDNDSPYSVMFGPDKCYRDTNKVHFIFQHENPLSHEWEEKHFKDAPKVKEDKGFHVYTLHVKADNSFDLYIDTEVASSGNLLEDVDPPVTPAKEIDDPDDNQPEEWVTQAKIADLTAVKPDDWDEDAPKKIIDESADMPKGWLQDAEEFIPDLGSTMPEDWDEEEDGEWEAVMVVNPLCVNAPGCGKWEKPMIRNPDFKGPWKSPKIDNPDYEGPWSPRKIPNPSYFEDPNPSNMAPITGLAVEVWSVDGGVWLDNFVVGDDISAALKLAEETWRPKFNAFEATVAAEKEAKKLEKEVKKKEKAASMTPSKLVSASRQLVDKARPYLPERTAPALDLAGENPIACIFTLLAGLIAVFLMTMRKKGKPAAAALPEDGPGNHSADDGEETSDDDADDGGDDRKKGRGDQVEEEEEEEEDEDGVATEEVDKSVSKEDGDPEREEDEDEEEEASAPISSAT